MLSSRVIYLYTTELLFLMNLRIAERIQNNLQESITHNSWKCLWPQALFKLPHCKKK